MYAKKVAAHLECRAIAPHSFCRLSEDHIKEEREAALAFGLSVLKLCKALVICGDRISSGMKGEIKMARELGIPVYRMMETGTSGIALIKEKEKQDEM